MTRLAQPAAAPQQYDVVEVAALRPHPANPRRGNVEVIAESIAEHGFYGTIVVQRSTGFVLAGNHRLQAAQLQGITEVPVVYVDVDDAQAQRILLVDNRSNDLATYDTEALLALLNEVPDLAGTGYVYDDLDDLVASLGAVPVLAPQESEANFNETPEEEAARSDGETLASRGLREAVLIVSAAEYDEMARLFAVMRKHLGDMTQGALALRALRATEAVIDASTGHDTTCACQWCALRRSGIFA